MSAGLEADYRAVRADAGLVDLARDVVRATGAAAESFLQGQLSQDLAPIAPGVSAWSFLLAPQGKVDCFLRITRVDGETFLLDTDPGWAPALITRLERFRLRVACELEPLEWRCLAMRGPNAHAATDRLGPPVGSAIDVVADWPGLPGIDRLGPLTDVPTAAEAGAAAGLRACGIDAYEAVRVEAGVPRMGAELTERTIPAEAGVVDRAVSFTKGCFTGQELVARIDSRGGKVPRHLRGIVIGGGEQPPVGGTVVVDGSDVGALTSVASSPGLDAAVALGYVKRSVDVPADALVRWESREAPARLHALPLVS